MSRQCQIAVTRSRYRLPQLRQMADGDVEQRIGHRGIGSAHVAIALLECELVAQLEQPLRKIDTRYGNRILPPTNICGTVAQQLPTHIVHRRTNAPDILLARQGNGIFDIDTHIVVAQYRNHTVGCPNAAENRPDTVVDFRMAYMCQIAAEHHQIGTQ